MSESAVAAEEKQAAQNPAQTQAQAVEFSQADETAADGQGTSIDILLDMEVPVTVVIGQTEIPIQRLLQLSPGAVLKLDKAIDMPVDLYLKDSRFATGHVVVVDDKFAVRIKTILTGKTAQAEDESARKRQPQ